MSEEKENDGRLENLKWELFAQEYVKPGEWFLNGAHAYSVVYGLDYEKDNDQCRAHAARLVANGSVMDRIMCFLSEGGLNDATVANRLKELFATDREKVASYAKLLYGQACLINGISIENPTEFSALRADLMV